MSKLFGWFNKNKNENKTPEPATPPTQEDTTDNSEAVIVEEEQVTSAPDAANEAAQSSPAESVQTPLPVEPENVSEEVEVTPETPVAPEPEPELVVETTPVPDEVEAPAVAEPVVTEKKSFFGRLKDSLSRTKANLGSDVVSLIRRKAIDDGLDEELET